MMQGVTLNIADGLDASLRNRPQETPQNTDEIVTDTERLYLRDIEKLRSNRVTDTETLRPQPEHAKPGRAVKKQSD